jgi:LysR family transcriptional activator of glutamate synthase operon
LDLLQLQYFVSVARSDTMLQAATTLNVSQSTLSMSIKKLEKELETQLFQRDGRSLRLTTDGQFFLDGAEKLLIDAVSLKQKLLSARETRSRTLVVAADAIDFALESIYLYKDLNPQVMVKHMRSERKAMREHLLTHEADFCITLEPVDDFNIESTLLLSEPMMLLASRNSRFFNMTSVSMYDLENETLVTMGTDHAIRTLFESYYSILGMQPKTVLEVGETEVMSLSVSNNFGITFIPRSVINKESSFTSNKNVCVIPIKESFCYRNVYL